jgi:hypothetical protein
VAASASFYCILEATGATRSDHVTIPICSERTKRYPFWAAIQYIFFCTNQIKPKKGERGKKTLLFLFPYKDKQIKIDFYGERLLSACSRATRTALLASTALTASLAKEVGLRALYRAVNEGDI